VAAAATAAAGLALPGTAHAAEAAGDGPTIYIASDSTAQTYDPYYAPQTGWGQVLDQFFADDVTIANHAIGGRSSRSFIEQGRLDAILDEIQPGDYLFVQFGHNDATISRPERYTPPADYKEYLRNDYIAGARERGAIPVIVTPVSRRDFDPATGKFNVSFPAYVAAAEEVAAEEGVPLVDLGASSRAYLDSIGPEEAKSVFLHVPPNVYANRPYGTIDETHFQEYGAVQMARLIAEDVARLDVPLAAYVENTERPAHRPERAGGVSASAVSHTGARLTWEEAAGADLYRVFVREIDDEDADYRLAASSPIPLADIAGLAEGTRYDVRVVAVNRRGQAPPSHRIRFTTATADQRFDFGPAGSPVAEGYTGVDLSTLYSAGQGYGFADTANLTATDRGEAAGFDDATRDFVSWADGRYSFSADVPNGTYAVTATVGDPAGASRSGFVLEGGDRGQVIVPSGSVTAQTLAFVTVADGRLDVTVYGTTAHLNSLVLSQVA
jgi:lysophospholipase L1-like esterase